MSKKGQSTAFAWFYGLVTLFGIGVLYIIFNQVFHANLVPLIKTQVNATPGLDVATMAEVNDNIDRYMFYFNLLPIVLFFVVVLFMIIAAIRKEQENQFM